VVRREAGHTLEPANAGLGDEGRAQAKAIYRGTTTTAAASARAQSYAMVKKSFKPTVSKSQKKNTVFRAAII
jgi:hypothetical protein